MRLQPLSLTPGLFSWMIVPVLGNVTGLVAAGPVPTSLIASTDSEYVAPGVSWVKVCDLADADTVVDHDAPPALPPSRAMR